MRVTLGQLRGGAADGMRPRPRTAGLDRLPALGDAVTGGGRPGDRHDRGRAAAAARRPDHAAYRILQESLTNVLRHAGPGRPGGGGAALRARAALVITVTDDGTGPPAGGTRVTPVAGTA